MADPVDTTRVTTASSIFGISVGTGLTLWLKTVSPTTPFTETMFTLVAGITVIADKVGIHIGRWWGRRMHRRSLGKALERTDEFLQNPDTPEDHRQALMVRKQELQIAAIDATIFNPVEPPRQ